MWQIFFISIISLFIASIVIVLIFQRCSRTNHSYRSLTTNAYVSPTMRQDWSEWQRSLLVPTLSEPSFQDLTIQEKQRLHFVRWLVRHGRLTEWIIDTSNVV
jgi:hypothetical protein